jgi:hypothetical protein
MRREMPVPIGILAGSSSLGGAVMSVACALIERTRAVSKIHSVIRQCGAVAATS